jgi:hypothetical protein
VVAVAVVVGVVGVAAATLLVGMFIGVDVGGSAVVWLGSLLGTKKTSNTQDNANANEENAYLPYRLRFRGENDTKNPSYKRDGGRDEKRPIEIRKIHFSSAHHM